MGYHPHAWVEEVEMCCLRYIHHHAYVAAQPTCLEMFHVDDDIEAGLHMGCLVAAAAGMEYTADHSLVAVVAVG